MKPEPIGGPDDPEIVFALYRPHSGKDAELRALVAEHVPTLRRLELITSRPAVAALAKDGSIVEVFEWTNPRAAGVAHTHPDVARIWEAMGKVSDMIGLADLPNAHDRFPHFAPLEIGAH